VLQTSTTIIKNDAKSRTDRGVSSNIAVPASHKNASFIIVIVRRQVKSEKRLPTGLSVSVRCEERERAYQQLLQPSAFSINWTPASLVTWRPPLPVEVEPDDEAEPQSVGLVLPLSYAT